MYHKIVLAGGTGHLGSVLREYYRDKAEQVVVLSRSVYPSEGSLRYVQWDGRTPGPWVAELEGADLLVNLSGKNVNCRYTEKNKREIFRSRLEPTAVLGKAIGTLQSPPKAWINLSSATIYRHAEDRPQDEDNGEIGSGFSVAVCTAWEKVFREADTPLTKKIILRTGMVIGKLDAVLPRLRTLARFGLGGRQGHGRQLMAWVHEQDFARVTEWVLEQGRDGDLFNVTAPEAIRNSELMRLVRHSVGIPLGLPAPAWLLELGAFLIRTETELILKSRWVYPKRLLERGFQFRYKELAAAISRKQ